jgi:hypothetical protein
MVVALKNNSVWDSLGVLYVFASGTTDTAFAKINWKNPGTFKGKAVGAVGYNRVSGFKGGTTQGYLDLGTMTSTDLGWTNAPGNNGHIGLWSYDAVTPNYETYAISAGSADVLLNQVAGNVFWRFSTGGSSCGSTPAQPNNGYFLLNAISGISNAYRNNTLISSNCTQTFGNPTHKMFFLANNPGTNTPNTFSQTRLSIVHFGAGLSSGKRSTLNSVFTTYINGL